MEASVRRDFYFLILYFGQFLMLDIYAIISCSCENNRGVELPNCRVMRHIGIDGLRSYTVRLCMNKCLVKVTDTLLYCVALTPSNLLQVFIDGLCIEGS